ncbi:MAG TPA: hypothetical protein VHC19_02405 [Pirellulales bacterium]|nr:hypothetical protein [Pirellulales bacterium]
MTGFSESIGLKLSTLALVISLTCLAGSLNLGAPACWAAEPGLLPELETTEPADDALPAGPLLKAAEANTPARLDDGATGASQPISSRPLMCCRPAPSAAQGAQTGAQVHPTLAALAEAVRPRRGASRAPTKESAQQQVAPDATETAIESSASASEVSEPEPLHNDSFEAPSPITAPAAPPAKPDEKRAPLTVANPWAEKRAPLTVSNRWAEKSAPLTVANPWAARLAPGAIKEQAPPPANEPVAEPTVEPVAEPTSQQRAWRSADPRPVRLARYHRPEARAAASISPAAVDRKPDAVRNLPAVSADENPLRGRETSSGPRAGVWSSAADNPLR